MKQIEINKSFEDMTSRELAEFIVDERIRCAQIEESDREWAIERELRSTRESLIWSAERLAEWHAEEDAMEEDEMSDRPFNIDELYDFLGEFVEDYDIQGILDDATECDPITGNRFWKVSALDPDDFQRLVDAHEKSIHEETLENVADAIGTAFRSFRDQLNADASAEEDDDERFYSDRRSQTMEEFEYGKLEDELGERLSFPLCDDDDDDGDYDDDQRFCSDCLSPTLAECEDDKLAEQAGRQISFPFPLTVSDEARTEYSEPDFTHYLPDDFFHLNPDDEGDRIEYERMLQEAGQKLEEGNRWTSDDQNALDMLNAIWAYEPDEVPFGDSWTEWVCLAAEQEEITLESGPVWVWVPEHASGEIAGTDHPFLSRKEALDVFNRIDPFNEWMCRRLAEASAGSEMELDRRFVVYLVCQNVRDSEDGIESVRDDSVSLWKSFDILDDVKAQKLIKALFA